MLVDKLADYAVATRTVALPVEVIHAVKRCVVDWFAATIPGSILPPATLLVAALEEDLDRGEAVLVPSGRRATARFAALINGSAAHAVEFDDIFRDAIYHPGAPVIAAALAAAQTRHVSGEQFLRGVIAGYEISTRIGVAVTPAHYEYWHTTGTVGTFGAAVAAAVILGLDSERTAHALANAGTMAAGLQQAFRSDAMSKPLHAGRAAETGMLVALAAEQGVTGAKDILEGRRGFGAAMSRDADWYGAFGDLSARSRYNITRITQKNHGCCGHTFAAVDGVIALREEHKLSAENVKRITVGTYAKALEITGNPKPRTAFEAKFSLPYCVAVALLTGQVRLDAFSSERLADPQVHQVMARFELQVDPEIDAAFPRQRAAMVEIETTDGNIYRHHSPTRKGDPDNPLTDEELTAKYRELVIPVIGKRPAESLLDLLWRLDSLKDTVQLLTGR
ncbi:MAG: MmgE/PrpD family protein [Gammaproteobacteria bacterium]|nr:MAG: MmgE/PrpD family protein [Gammaproteobacteria bacterium]